MRIVCDHCRTAYEIDESDPVLSGQSRAMRFRCGACGQFVVISARSGDGPPTSPVVSSVPLPARGTASSAAADSDPLLQLKQAGKVYNIRDLSTLQRWIVERRVVREDLITVNGLQWEPVGNIPELSAFFLVVEQADRAFTLDALGSMNPVSPSPTPPSGPADQQPWERSTEDLDSAGTGPPLGSEHGAGASDLAAAGPGVPDAAVPRGEAARPVVIPVDGGSSLPFRSEGAAVADHGREVVDATDAPEPWLCDPPSGALPPIEMMARTGAEAVDAADLHPGGADRTDVVVDPDMAILADWSEDSADPTVRVDYDERRPGPDSEPSLPAGSVEADLDIDWAPRRRSRAWVLPVALLVAAVAVFGWWWTERPDSGGSGEGAPAVEPPVARSTPSANAAEREAPDGGEVQDAESQDAESQDAEAQDAEAQDAEAQPDGAGHPDAPSVGEDAGQPGRSADRSPGVGRPPNAGPTEPGSTPAPGLDDGRAKEWSGQVEEAAPAQGASAGRAATPSGSRQSASPRDVSVKGLLDRGWRAVSQDDFRGAFQEFEQATKTAPSSADAWYGLGYAEDKLGRSESARVHYCRALTLTDPTTETGREVTGRLRVNGLTCN